MGTSFGAYESNQLRELMLEVDIRYFLIKKPRCDMALLHSFMLTKLAKQIISGKRKKTN